jgi:sugar/nucleoside kinase (ribokinase family)
MPKTLDVLGLGCVAVDDLLYVDVYPPPEVKVPVQRRERQCGGLTATALVAAARLGAACAYAGTLGNDELSRFALERLHEEGVDLSAVRRRNDARPIHSVVIVSDGGRTRTIFYDLTGATGAEVDWPDEALIRAARVLFVDHFGIEGMVRAARVARAAGIPVVADLENNERAGFAELLGLVDHLLVSRAFATRLTGAAEPTEVVERLWTADCEVVLVTGGAEGSWYRSREGRLRHQPAFPIDVVDTTGCGDVFHGAYAAALARGESLPERVRFASAAAALKATRHGGQSGIPTRSAVEAFLKERSQ